MKVQMKRWLSFLLAMVMVLGMMPMQVFAAEGAEPITEPTETTENVEESEAAEILRQAAKDAIFPLGNISGNIAVLGDSTISGYPQYSALSTYLSVADGYTVTDISKAGDTVAGQLNKWNALSVEAKNSLNYVFVQIGLNDMRNLTPESFRTRYKELIAQIRADSPDAMLILGTMVPCKARWKYLEPNNWEEVQARWESANEDIKNFYYDCDRVAYLHTDALGLDDNLRTEYDHGDHIHPNASGAKVIAYSWYLAAIGHSHRYNSTVTAPTCTEQGYTTHTCTCGDSYVDSYTAPLGHTYEAVITAPTCTEQGYTTYTCDCGDSYVDNYVDAVDHTYSNGICTGCGVKEWDTDGDGVLEILAIGNSFSVDALEYAYQIAQNLGIEKIVIGNLYISGCSLSTHASNAAGDKAKYVYYYNDSGAWSPSTTVKSPADSTISEALESRSWDYVSLQQSSTYSGVESTYNKNLTTLIDYVKERSDAKLVWHMTWAYQQDSTHSAFPSYGSDQMTMYNAIVSAVQNKILTNENFDLIVPNGTAVQNSRTSILGDTTTRDDHHMSYDYGRYLTGLMFIKVITGLDISGIAYAPSGVDADEMAVAVESVNNAYVHPFTITESEYVSETPKDEPEQTPEEVPEEGYILLQTPIYQGAFWHPQKDGRYNELIDDQHNSYKFFTSIRFTRETLPVGSIIVLENGWQYRPDGWVTDTLQSGSREGVTTKHIVLVTEEWWENYTIRSFNISRPNGGSVMDLTEEEMRSIFRIYVPEEKHTHTYENGICTGCGEKEISDFRHAEKYRWEIVDGKLTNITEGDFSPNAVSVLGGSITNGEISSGRYQLAKPLSLLHDSQWAVEWRGSGDWTGMLLATTPDAYDAGLPYFFKTGTDSGLVAFGHKNTQVDNYGCSLKSLGLDYTQSHTYRLENRIHRDGSNMVYLLVDNAEVGPMNHYYIGGSDAQNQLVNWLSGKDFSMSALGTSSHPINRLKLEYLQVMQSSLTHSYNAVVTAPTCTELGYTTYTCDCGESYVADYTDVIWHDNVGGSCSMCDCEMVRVNRDELTPKVGTVSSLDGTVNTTITTGWYWDIPIPAGAKQIRFMTFKTAASWGSAFLNESTYISGVCETVEGYQWVTVDIPEGATIFRHGYLSDARAEQNGRPLFQYVEFSDAERDASQPMPRPATGCHSFSVNVNIAPAMGDPDGNIVGTDYGYIMLPTNYTPYGEPTRLIIVCHGAGGKRSTYQSDSWKTDQNTFWTDMGYAIMDMAACPKPLTTDDRAIHYGNPTVVDCYKAGFDYVMENFNLKQDGIYVIGTSMGGLSSFQIVQSGKFPVLAQVGFCPAIDLFKQAYCAKWGSAERDYQKSHISSYFGFEGAPESFTNTFPTDEEIELYKNNFEKTVKYSPILRNVVDGDVASIFDAIPTSATGTDAAEAAVYAQLTATHPCPVMIIHSMDDSVVPYRYSQYFADMLKRSGQDARLYTINGVNHMAWQYGKNCTLQGINGQITIKESQYEAYKFFEKFEKHEEHQPWVDPAVAPTCTETGLTEGSHCASCGEILVKQNVIPASEVHTYKNGICTGCGSSVLDGNYTHAIPENQGVQNAIDRAYSLTDVEWTPLANVPGVKKINGEFTVVPFEAGKTYRGIPYSGVTANDCYVGLNVSLESFMTALENENSVLYTENLFSTNPKSATYFGTVCSKFVQYALDVPGSYNTNNVANIPGMETIALPGKYTVDQIKLGDVVLHTQNHTTICTDILYDADGNVAFIEISEAVMPLCRRMYWSPEEFYEHFEGYRLCRYQYIDQTPAIGETELTDDYALMPRFGDKYNYKVSSTKATVDVLESGYHKAVILRDGVVIDEIVLNGATAFKFDRSVPGYLEMYLEKEDGTRSNSVYANVVKSSVSVDDSKDFARGALTVTIEGSSGTPLYVQVGSAHAIFCNVEGREGTVEITFPASKISTRQVRVAYQNEYGIYLSNWVSFTADENPSKDPLLSQGQYWNGYNITPSSPTPVVQENRENYWSYTMIPVEENTTYYSWGATRIWYLDAKGDGISTYNAYKDSTVPCQFTTPEGTAYVSIAYSPNLLNQGEEKLEKLSADLEDGNDEEEIVPSNPSTDPYLSQGEYWDGYTLTPSSHTPVVQSGKTEYWTYTMIPVEENTTYYSKGCNRMWFLDAKGNPISTFNANTESDVRFQFTTPAGTAYVSITYAPSGVDKGTESMQHIHTYENGVCTGCGEADPNEVAEPLDLRYDDHYDVTGKTVEIVDAGTPTSYQVGYGVEENKVLDTAVVTLEGNYLVATGIGTAKVRIDGVLYEVTVTAAPISLLLVIGQSNAEGMVGNANQSVACENGQVYSTYAKANGLTGDAGLTVENASNYVPSALTGPHSTVNVNGTDTKLSGHPVNSLTEEGSGKYGMDSGLAYEWTKQTGEKVWVVNAAHGASSISSWQPGQSNYEEAKALLGACQEVLMKEIAAGHYTFSHMGYYWCQGCADETKSAEWYVGQYLAMHEGLKTEFSFDGDLNVNTPDDTMEFGNIVLVMAGHENAAGYRTGTYTDSSDNFFASFKELEMRGPRVAQIWMANNPELEDIHIVCTLAQDWVTMPDGSDGVAEYFATHYENGVIDYPTQVKQSTSWYKPTTPAAVKNSIHYYQVGYNEVGRESVRNTLYILGLAEKPDVETTVTFVDWTGYQIADTVKTSTVASTNTLVVPMVYPCYESKNVTYSVSDNLIYSYYDLLDSGVDGGTLTASIGSQSVQVIGRDYYAYRFELDNGKMVSVSDSMFRENALTQYAGQKVFTTAEPIILKHDKPWRVEFNSVATDRFMALATTPSSTEGMFYFFKSASNSGVLSMGEYKDGKYQNYGLLQHKVDIDWNQPHVYRFQNVINEDGTNTVHIYIDDVWTCTATELIIDGASKGTGNMYLSGKDFAFTSVGCGGFGLSTGQMTYLEVWEDYHTHTYENGVCTGCGDININWEIGTIAAASGANAPNTTRLRITDYLALADFAGVSVNMGYQLTWLAYDAEKHYIGNGTTTFTGYWQPSGQSIATADIQNLYSNAVYFRLAMKAVSGGSMTLEDVRNSGVTFIPFGEPLPEPEYELEYENSLNIGSWQDGAIWNGKLFVLGDSGTGAVFDLGNMSKLATFSLDSMDVLKPHANSVCFGSTYYAPGDEYPLLYVNVYNNYASAADRMEGTCGVYRIFETDGGFVTELVQIIEIGFTEDLTLWKSKENNGDVRPYGNFLVDTEENKLYAYVMRDAAKATRFFKFDLPKLTDGIYSETYGCNVVTLASADIEGQFDTEYFKYLQGGTYSSGMILSAEGFNAGSSAEPAIRIIDLQTGTVSATYYMANSGLSAEPEVICVDPASGLLYYAPADGTLRILTIPDVHFHTYENGVCTGCGAKEPVSHIPGDITGDGELNNKDVTRLFKYLSGYDVEVDEAALDVNGDGEVNNKDVTRLFRYLSGFDVTIH